MEILDDDSGMSIIKKIDWDIIPALEAAGAAGAAVHPHKHHFTFASISFQPAGAADITVTVEYMDDDLKPDLFAAISGCSIRTAGRRSTTALASAMPK